MSRLKAQREVDALVAAAVLNGWRCRSTGKHYVLRGPDGQTVTVSKTPSDFRAVRNIRADLRRAGVPLR